MDAKTRFTYDSKIFNGISVQFDDTENAEEKAAKLAALPEIKQHWPVRLYSIPKPRVEWIGQPDVEVVGTRKKRAINETEEDIFSPHVMTQVDKLRAEGVTGKGIKVAVVDTGVSGSGRWADK